MRHAIYTSRPIFDTDRAIEIVRYALTLASLREKAYPRAVCVVSLDECSVVRVHTRAGMPRVAGAVCYANFGAADAAETLAVLMDKCAAACRAAQKEASR